MCRVECSTVLLQRPGWLSGDRGQRMGCRSHPLRVWQSDAARPLSRAGVAGFKCLCTAVGWAAGPFVPCAERWPRARRRLVTRSREDPLPSSEAEIGHPLEGRSATLERGGDCPAGQRGTLERGGDWSPARGGCGWAAYWASSGPSLSSEWEAGRGPSWAQLPYQVFVFLKAVLVPPLGCP